MGDVSTQVKHQDGDAVVSLGVNQSIFLEMDPLVTESAGRDVIVYYPTASVSNRELAEC